ncbi:hypothetical protein E2320_007284 [Naja naja]|nr:hypothetical protein E2320_007284 [Naja naja]
MWSNCQNGGRHSRIEPPHPIMISILPVDSTESHRFARKCAQQHASLFRHGLMFALKLQNH